MNTALFQYQYDAGSNEIHRYAYLPNNVTIDQNYARDSLDRMASRLVKKNGTTFSSEAYTLDHMDRLTQTARGNTADAFGFYLDGNLEFATYGGQPQIPYTEGQDPDLDTTDTIDPNAGYQPPDSEEPEPTPPPPAIDYVPPNNPDQDAQQSPGAQRIVGYALDRPGNRSVMLDTVNGNVTYSDNALNQYTGVSGSSITNGPEHEVQTFNGVTYSYINDEHLKQVSDGSGNNYYLYYDALGRCVKRTLNGTTTFYICDGEKPIVEYNSSGTIIARNVYGKGIDEILTRTETGVNNGYAMYYAQDHEGTVTHLLDGRSTPSNQTGNVIESYTYDVYGAPVFLDASGNQRNPNCTAYNNRFLFTGREYAATYRSTYVQTFTFYEYRARAYNPQLGRFMSEDPKLFDAGDYNLFRYCHNDPVDFTDPMGLDDTAPTYSPRQTSLQKAEEEYGKAMAAAQWAGSDLMHNATGAMGIGMTGYAYVQQTIVTGQLKGSMANPALLRNAKPGDPNDRDAPTGLEITNRVDDRGFYKQHHLQVKDGKGIWKGTGIAEEHVEARAGNLRLQPSGPTLFEHGDLVDRVGPLRQPGPNVTGYLLTHQSYKLYYPTPEGLRYINLPGPGFWQYTNIYRGQVTNADLGYWGH